LSPQTAPTTDGNAPETVTRLDDDAAQTVPERRPWRDYPLSCWYVIPITKRLAALLAPTWVRPAHITGLGLLLGLSAVVLLIVAPAAGLGAAALVLGAWFMDRTDGLLARRQGTATPLGAWLDANVDELHDVAWHAAGAYAAARVTLSPWPWYLLAGFLGGKYLFINSVHEERVVSGANEAAPASPCAEPSGHRWLRTLYHLPGNADIRLHLLVTALATGWMTIELALIALYYNLRWIIRFAIVPQRLGGRS